MSRLLWNAFEVRLARIAVPSVLIVTQLLMGIDGWLLLSNPEINGTSREDGFACSAAWDTVLNGASNVPGGEPTVDGDVISRVCREAGEDQFFAAVVVEGLAVVVAAVGAALVWRRRHLQHA